MGCVELQRSKFNVSDNKDKRTYDGIVFDSELEMKYYRDVVCPKFNSGEIVKFELQNLTSYNLNLNVMGKPYYQLSMLQIFIYYIKMDMKR